MDYSSSSTVSDESLSYKLKKSQRLKTTWVVGEPSPPRPRFLRYNPHRSKEILTRIQKAIEVRTTVISAEEQENQSTAEIIEEEGEDDIEEDEDEDEDEEKKSGCFFKGLFKLLCVMYVLMQWSSYMSNTNSSSSPVLLPIGAEEEEEGEGYYWRNQTVTFEFEKEWKQPFGDELLLHLLGKTSEEEEGMQLMSELGDDRIESLLDDDEEKEEEVMLLEEEIPFLNYSSSSEVDDDFMKEEISNSALESGDYCENSMRDPPLPPADNALIPAVNDEDPKDSSSCTNLDQLMLTSGGNLEEEVAEKPVGEAVTSSTIQSIHMMLKALVSFAVLSFISLVAVCYLRRNLHNKNKPTTSLRRSSRHNRPSAATATATTCVKDEEKKEGAEEGHDVARAPTVELLSELEFQPQNEKVMPLLPLQPPASFEFSITDSRSCRSTNRKKKKKTAANDEDADNEATTSKAIPLTTPIRRSTRLQNRTTIQSPYATASATTTAKSFR